MVRLFSAYGQEDRWLFVVGLVASLFSRLVALVPPLVLGVAIDALFTPGTETAYRLPIVPDGSLPSTPEGQLWLSLGLIVGASILTVGLSWAQGVSLSLYSNRVQHAIRTDTYATMQRLDTSFFDDKQTGEVMSILNSDVRNLREFLGSTLSGAVQLVVSAVGIGAVLFWLNAQLAAVTLVAMPVLVVFTVAFMRTIRPRYRALRASVGDLNTRLENNLSGIEVIKTSNTEVYEDGRIEDASWDYYLKTWAVAKLEYFYQPGMELAANVAFAATFAIGGYWLVTESPGFIGGGEALRVGEFVTFLFMTQRFVDPLAGAGRIVNSYENARASGERIFGLTDLPVTVVDGENAVDLGHVEGRIEYDDVSFAYEEGRPVLTDVSFVAEPGETVALVGPTGAGKSTAAKLLLRLYDITDGSVRLDGVDVREATLDSLRRAVGYVSQDVYLFDGTVRENLVYGAFDATESEMVAAAKAAEAHEFVTELPDGYDTRIGERGIKLSGGQRQRLSIARAMLQDPDVLVLDEATSAVDTETELLIQRALTRLTEDRTTLVIAHRLSTIRRADRILVLEGGRVVERGTHDELVDSGGLYATLWGVQAGEFDQLDEAAVARLVRERADD
ncbi:multidrug ABC transporter ATP-binding protein [Haloprofundus marisrubri]|uniref:Multidrug ABC transporter ATP-binding protein n=1 Tax=Haloprofundus marisrubri TaxID=1514971 RepID=A0A0W1R974_9EURY|nr:ABC transporter ATP-binding protein [Haloprofundus marisrubri]KTG09556.1 multidrug ABC transporter ATP-binding protein [Haloprofundus marisrubri]